jgi:4-alpha-glucanotransferase
MNISFHLHYRTTYGEVVGIAYYFENNEVFNYPLQSYDGENWSGTLTTDLPSTLYYKYVILSEGKVNLSEWGKYRKLDVFDGINLFAEDSWRPRANENNVYVSTAFSEAIFRRKINKTKSRNVVNNAKNQIRFKLNTTSIQSHLCFGVIGNIPELGAWKTPKLMDDRNYPEWSIDIPVENSYLQIEYKYVIVDPSDLSIKIWEHGDNRRCSFALNEKQKNQIVISDSFFRFEDQKWCGAGVAIPVFSLRSEKDFGIGEFTDLKLLTDWAASTGMNLIQVLPVNDTIANKSWLDSYPYAAISVFALHPLYINVPQIAAFADKGVEKQFKQDQKMLNKLEKVDFEKVLELKFKYLNILFEQEYATIQTDKAFQKFLKDNENWLPSYGIFCHLRDKYETCNFTTWPEFAVFNDKVIKTLNTPTYDGHRKIVFYYFVQYHADKQLREAKEYARSKGIVLKGDLPIGIYRFSCDAWVAPDLYNMSEQAGAPPDDYAVLGQNWGFPTYNWEKMAVDGFAWWKQRMQILSRYFDAMRIDHILGFFRIWQIPTDQIEGTMGSFKPRMPISLQELENFGIHGDLSRYTEPYITEDRINALFGADAKDIFKHFFTKSDGRIIFKPTLNTQQKIHHFVSENPNYEQYEKILFGLISDVLLLAEPNSHGQYFNPRITLTTTYSFGQLDKRTQAAFKALYNEYFFSRHDQFWKEQAIWKLPAIMDASDMLICGEDLGMIPDSVPGVMKEMNIMSLEIQRMPKGNEKFGNARKYPYFSVCSPSCHDMSTIRGWWQADHENAKDFYYNYLHGFGLTPMDCLPDIVQAILDDHLSSPSMLCIVPLQDWLALDKNLRKADAFSEQINEPSNPKHYWRYRFHMPIEDLQKATDLNLHIKELVAKSGRIN